MHQPPQRHVAFDLLRRRVPLRDVGLDPRSLTHLDAGLEARRARHAGAERLAQVVEALLQRDHRPGGVRANRRISAAQLLFRFT